MNLFPKGEGDAKTAICHTEAPGGFSVHDHITWMSWRWSLTNCLNNISC